jgi:hypothetical protein
MIRRKGRRKSFASLLSARKAGCCVLPSSLMSWNSLLWKPRRCSCVSASVVRKAGLGAKTWMYNGESLPNVCYRTYSPAQYEYSALCSRSGSLDKGSNHSRESVVCGGHSSGGIYDQC